MKGEVRAAVSQLSIALTGVSRYRTGRAHPLCKLNVGRSIAHASGCPPTTLGSAAGHTFLITMLGTAACAVRPEAKNRSR